MSTYYLPTALLHGGACGGAYVGANAHGQKPSYRYYVCSMQSRRLNAKWCRNERVDADGLEEIVLGKVVETYADSELFEQALAAAAAGVPEKGAKLVEQAAATHTTIARTEKALEPYYEVFELENLSAEDRGCRIEDLIAPHGSARSSLKYFRNGLSWGWAGQGTLTSRRHSLRRRGFCRRLAATARRSDCCQRSWPPYP